MAARYGHRKFVFRFSFVVSATFCVGALRGSALMQREDVESYSQVCACVTLRPT